MKRLIILFLVICSTVCDLDSCINEEDLTKCSSHIVDEIDGYSCRLTHYDFDTEEEEEDDVCGAYPDSAEDQKLYWRLVHGEGKEALSAQRAYLKENLDVIGIPVPTKDYFAKDETVEIELRKFTDDEKKTLLNANSCAYQYAGRFLDNPEAKINITDKNTCLNAYQFSELKNLVNCGISTITFNISGNTSTINTCFFIPDNHLQDNTKKLFKQLFVDAGIFSILGNYALSYLNSKPKKFSRKTRKLQDENIKYEIVVEDKYGKKYKYVNDEVEPEVIEEGLQGNRIYDSGYSKTHFIQINLLLLIISLILY
jgi:hypothetical protein